MILNSIVPTLIVTNGTEEDREKQTYNYTQYVKYSVKAIQRDITKHPRNLI